MNIGVLGHYQTGKSTLINCLMGELVCAMGDGAISTTKKNSKHLFREGVFLIDTPGMDANAQDDAETSSIVKQLDFSIIVLQNKEISTKDLVAINLLQKFGVPILVLINCTDYANKNKWNPQSDFNKTILRNVEATLQNKLLVCGIEILLVNLQWYWYAIEGYKKEDGEKQNEVIERVNYLLGHNIDNTILKEQSNVPKLIHFLSNDSNFVPIQLYQKLNCNLNNEIEYIVKLSNKILK